MYSPHAAQSRYNTQDHPTPSFGPAGIQCPHELAAHTRRAFVFVESANWARSAPLAIGHDFTADLRHGDAPAQLPAGKWRIAAAAHHACGVELPIFLRIEYADVGGCARA